MPEVKQDAPGAVPATEISGAVAVPGNAVGPNSYVNAIVRSGAGMVADPDPTLAADSNWRVPTQKAVKAFTAALLSELSLSYDNIEGLDSSEAGALYATAIISSLSLTPGQGVMVDSGGTNFEPAPFGTAAFVDALPSGAPPSASSSSGAITLNYAGQWIIATAQTEEIDDITLSGIADYATVLWQVQTTADGITFPASVTRITGGSLAVTTTAGAAMVFLIQSVGAGAYWVFFATAEAVA